MCRGLSFVPDKFGRNATGEILRKSEAADHSLVEGLEQKDRGPRMWSEMLSLMDLTARFIEQQTAERTAGIAEPPVFEVEPHESVAGVYVEPRLAWRDALIAPRLLDPRCQSLSMQPVPGWGDLVAARRSVLALPMACGHFPQMVRDLPNLLRIDPRLERMGSPLEFPSKSLMVEWSESVVSRGRLPEALVAVGLARLAGEISTAVGYLEVLQPQVTDHWQLLWENERAAIAWFDGHWDLAAEIWNQLPEQVPILFNRGMCQLFLGDQKKAQETFQAVIPQIPEDSNWLELAQLYSALTRFERTATAN